MRNIFTAALAIAGMLLFVELASAQQAVNVRGRGNVVNVAAGNGGGAQAAASVGINRARVGGFNNVAVASAHIGGFNGRNFAAVNHGHNVNVNFNRDYGTNNFGFNRGYGYGYGAGLSSFSYSGGYYPPTVGLSYGANFGYAPPLASYVYGYAPQASYGYQQPQQMSYAAAGLEPVLVEETIVTRKYAVSADAQARYQGMCYPPR